MAPNNLLSYNQKAGPIAGQTDTTLYKPNYSIHTLHDGQHGHDGHYAAKIGPIKTYANNECYCMPLWSNCHWQLNVQTETSMTDDKQLQSFQFM